MRAEIVVSNIFAHLVNSPFTLIGVNINCS